MLSIVSYPDPGLRRPAVEIPTGKIEELTPLFEELEQMLAADNGAVGLAGCQVGIPWAVAAIKQVDGEGHIPDGDICKTSLLINPKIIQRMGPMVSRKEGCLSVGSTIQAKVLRQEDIVLSWQDRSGESHTERMKGYIARIVTHEVDHLQGVLCFDRMQPTQRKRVLQKYWQMKV